MKGRIIIVTGAGSGLGRAAAVYLAGLGCIVVAADVNESAAAQVAEQINSSDGKSLAYPVDVTERPQVQELAAECRQTYGQIDGLLHCAGIARGSHQWQDDRWRRMEELEDEDWNLITKVNLTGTFIVNQVVGRHMISREHGAILNVASLSAVVANKGLLGHGAYCASKAGVVALSRVLATEWAEFGVRVNSISPGYMDTGLLERSKSIPGLYQQQLDMTPMRRYGQPEEFAQTAAFLLSDDSSFVTGHNLMMDGGYSAW